MTISIGCITWGRYSENVWQCICFNWLVVMQCQFQNCVKCWKGELHVTVCSLFLFTVYKWCPKILHNQCILLVFYGATRISSRLDCTARCWRWGGGMGMLFVSMPRQCLKVIRSWTKSVKWAKSPGQTLEPVPKSVSSPSDGQGPWGGHQHGWISCPAYPAQVFKWVWAVLILLNALFGPGRTNRRTDTHTHTHTHTRQNLYIIRCGL